MLPRRRSVSGTCRRQVRGWRGHLWHAADTMYELQPLCAVHTTPLDAARLHIEETIRAVISYDFAELDS